jgi:hypothetical protein
MNISRYANIDNFFQYPIYIFTSPSGNDGLPEIWKMKYRNQIPEPGTTISGFADSKKKKKNI